MAKVRAGGMNISSAPRHKRQGFIARIISNGLAQSASKSSSDDELSVQDMIDFSPPSEADIIETNFLAKLADEICADSEFIRFQKGYRICETQPKARSMAADQISLSR